MLFVNGRLFAYVVCACLYGFEAKEHDETDWLDPNDLINYDPITMTMRNRQNIMDVHDLEASSVTEALSETPGNTYASNEKLENINCSKCESEVTELLAKLDSCNAMVSDLKKQTAGSIALHQQAFFQQYINVLLDKFKNFKTLNNGHYEVELKMTTEQFAYLQKYSRGEFTSTQEVHSVLSSMFHYIRWKSFDSAETGGGSELWSVVLEHWRTVIQIICTVSSSLLVCIHCQRSPRLITMLVLSSLFIASFLWTWYHLYLKEKAAHMAKQHKVMPESCDSSWGKWISSYLLLQTDECAAFYENLTIDPLVAVPPTKALAVFIIKFILEPAEHIGEALNKLIRAAFSGLPFYLSIPVFALIVVLLVLSIFVVSGYRLRTPFFSIEPHRSSDTELSQRVAELEGANTRLRRVIEARPCGAAGIEDVDVSLARLGQDSHNQQFQQPQETLSDRQHRRSAKQQPMLTGMRGEGDRPLENKTYGETCSRIIAGNDQQERQSEVARDIISGKTTETKNDQPTVKETNSACKDDQPSVNYSQTFVGPTTDTDSCQDDWLVVSQADTVNHQTASPKLTEQINSESLVSFTENYVAASQSTLLNCNSLSPQTLCADVNDRQ